LTRPGAHGLGTAGTGSKSEETLAPEEPNVSNLLDTDDSRLRGDPIQTSGRPEISPARPISRAPVSQVEIVRPPPVPAGKGCASASLCGPSRGLGDHRSNAGPGGPPKCGFRASPKCSRSGARLHVPRIGQTVRVSVTENVTLRCSYNAIFSTKKLLKRGYISA
jgi:hypothetical protein